MQPAQEQDRNHEYGGYERHQDAGSAPVLVPWVLLTIFKLCIDVINELKLEVNDRDNDNSEQVNALHKDKYVELCEVAFADAIVDPWAMVIVAVNTSLAEGAVSAPRSSNHFAVRTQTARL